MRNTSGDAGSSGGWSSGQRWLFVEIEQQRRCLFVEEGGDVKSKSGDDGLSSEGCTGDGGSSGGGSRSPSGGTMGDRLDLGRRKRRRRRMGKTKTDRRVFYSGSIGGSGSGSGSNGYRPKQAQDTKPHKSNHAQGNKPKFDD